MPNPTTDRPDPDELLSRIAAEESDAEKRGTRGHLKIFFGACAGVGKTYAMLNAAHQAAKEGIDVVLGLVETHGRDETARIAEGLPAIPTREIQYRGTSIREFDLDAALSQRPQLILLDELAHTNAPGSRHPKRWQDVEELLEAGIDVFSTLNVQHLESLNDVVARITGIWVKETVPDAFFDAADEISLVDIPSEELLKRLKEGKVYIAPGAKKRAAQNFFRKSNLIALRELALRRTAERVDAQMDTYKSRGGGAQAWSGADRILVCIGPDELSSKLVRVAKRTAGGLKSPWTALYVENERHYNLSAEGKEAVDHTLRLAERMGGRTQTVQGGKAADEVISFAKAHGITKIIVGKAKRPRWKEILYGSLADHIIRRSGDIEVYVVTGEPEKASSLRVPFWRTSAPMRFYASAPLTAGLFTLAMLPLRDHIQHANLVLPYLMGIATVALRYGRGPAFAATLLSAFCYNFFLVRPYFELKINEEQQIITFLVLLATGVLIGSQTARLRLQVIHARKREEHTSVLYAMTRELTGSRGKEMLASVAARHIAEVLESAVTIWIPDSKNQLQRVITEGEIATEIDPVREESAARWAYTHRQLAGLGTETLPGATGLYAPLIGSDNVIGVIAAVPEAGEIYTSEQTELLETFAGLAASALERALSAELVERTLLETEGEKLRNILLSSVSHDLRTPLASITGAASTLLLEGGKITEEYRDELLRLIHEEGARLARMVTNLLDVSSLESGSVKLNRELYFIEELIGSALMRTETKLGNRKVVTRIDPGLPLARMDGLLIEQVLINLLENAAAHTPAETVITIEAKLVKPELHVIVSDNGPGISPGHEERVFDKFYHATAKDMTMDEMVRQGGMGLAICRGIISAHNGRIWAENRPEGGARLTFTLPIKAGED